METGDSQALAWQLRISLSSDPFSSPSEVTFLRPHAEVQGSLCPPFQTACLPLPFLAAFCSRGPVTRRSTGSKRDRGHPVTSDLTGSVFRAPPGSAAPAVGFCGAVFRGPEVPSSPSMPGLFLSFIKFFFFFYQFILINNAPFHLVMW